MTSNVPTQTNERLKRELDPGWELFCQVPEKTMTASQPALDLTVEEEEACCAASRVDS